MTPNRSFTCVVHSVFERVCNLRLCDGSLISLGRRDVSNSPGIILCRTDDEFQFMDYLHTDTPGACRGNILRLGQNLQIDLRTAVAWQRRLAKVNACRLPDKWHSLLEYVRANPKFDRVEKIIGHWHQFIGTHNNLLMKLQPLVGKGPGLTPLGDDFIVGMVAGLETQPKWRGFLSNWLINVCQKTTDLSGRSLQYAAHGWFTEPILEFVDRISTPVAAAKLKRLLSIGDTSGTAMAYGCLIGFQVRQLKNLESIPKTDANSINKWASGNNSDQQTT